MDLNQEVNKMAVTNRTSKELPIVNQELKKVVNEYYKLVRRSKLSEQELDRMSEIWAKAEEDKKLSGWLDQIDFILSEYDKSNPQCKNEQEKDQAEKDEDLQYFLSEHIEVLTTQKIKERELKKNNSNSRSDSTYIIVCPDGAGSHQEITFDDGENGETIREWSKRRCSQCDHPYSEHLMLKSDKQAQTEVSDVSFPAI
jgi:hypothetical protein